MCYLPPSLEDFVFNISSSSEKIVTSRFTHTNSYLLVFFLFPEKSSVVSESTTGFEAQNPEGYKNLQPGT